MAEKPIPQDKGRKPREVKDVQPIMQHIMALRKVLLVSVVAILVAFILSFYFAGDFLVDLLTKPIVERGIAIIYTAVSEALLTKMKVCLVAAMVLASPVVLYELWSFISPALYPREKRKFSLLFVAALFLFLLGIAFCYGVVYAMALDFFLVSGEGLATPMLSIDKYIGYLFGFALPFGISFQVPVAIYITTSMGLTTPKGLSKARKFVLLGIAVGAAILTPPDVVSQVLLGIPMWILYEISVVISRMVKKKERA
ncbi:MAG: twin-arginine translocase subunit TatC [Clostridiales bacterium]|jgi:sec-independent protein translocase protein TatC|nr:twin-arginine translocase subunit TatC [Clostridiales bacterium]